MSNNTNTYAAIVAEAARISAAHKSADAASKDAHVIAMHDLWENAKQALSRDEQTRIWAEAFAPKVSGVKRFAGQKFRDDHPGAAAPALPAYITTAQAERKAAAEAKKAAAPDAPAKAEAPAKAPKATKAKATKAPAKAKEPTQKELLMALLAGQQELLLAVRELAAK